MPRASKSALAVASYTGDLRTHIFKINTDADGVKTVEEKCEKSTFAQGAVTLEYVCRSCHTSRDKKWAAKNSKNIH